MSGLVPKLRFPEFSNEWKGNFLKDVAKLTKGKGISKSDIIKDGVTPCIRYGELYTTYHTTIDKVISFTNADPKDLTLSNGNEVIIPASGEDAKDIATASVVKRSGVALGGDLNIIHSKNDGYFLASYLSGKKRLLLASLAQGNSVVHIYPAQLGSVHINFPSLPEQQKIADFLSSVDAKIDAIKRKRDAFERYKKGLMQQIFSQKIRFKQDDGSDFPEWEEKRLGDVASVVGGYAFKSLNFDAIGIPIVRISNINALSRYVDVSNAVYHPPLPKMEKFTIQYGDVLIALSGATTGKAAKYLSNKTAYLNQRVGRVILKKTKTYYDFLSMLVLSDMFTDQINRVLVAGAQPNISPKDIEDFLFFFPSLPEQQKIADFLSAVDAKIDAIKTQAAKLEAFKKGLLQQMFV